MTQLTLKMLRVRNNWTQEQAAKKVGVSKETCPDIPKLKKIESVFEISYNDINFLDKITV